MKKLVFQKEMGNFLGLFILIFAAVFSVITILNFSGTFNNNRPFVFINLDIDDEINDKCIQADGPDSIFIHEIDIAAPLVFPDESEGPDFREALDKGVILHPLSSLPGENGTIMILGHSAPVGWPKIKYDWVFSDLNNLIAGDRISVLYQSCQYSYQVSGKYFLEKGERLPDDLGDSESVLVLISCWPPGKDSRRIAIVAEAE